MHKMEKKDGLQKRVRTILLVCAIVFGTLDLLTGLHLMPFMRLSMAAVVFLMGIDELQNKKVVWGYILIVLSLSLFLLTLIELFIN